MEVFVLFLVFMISKKMLLSYKVRWDYLFSVFVVLIPLLDNHYYIRYLYILKKSFKKIFLLSSFVTFLINQYTFSLWIELIIFPLVMIPSILIVIAEESYEIDNRAQVISVCNVILSITFILIISMNVYELINGNYHIRLNELAVDYFLPLGTLIINLPVLFVWRYINMIDLQMQNFKHNRTVDYAIYLFRKLFLRIKIDLLTKINWSGIFIKGGTPMCYKILLNRKISYKELIQIIKAIESMAVPRNVYKDPQYKRIPIRIDVYYKNTSIINHIATWIEPWLKNDKGYSFVDNNLKNKHKGLYISSENM